MSDTTESEDLIAAAREWVESGERRRADAWEIKPLLDALDNERAVHGRTLAKLEAAEKACAAWQGVANRLAATLKACEPRAGEWQARQARTEVLIAHRLMEEDATMTFVKVRNE